MGEGATRTMAGVPLPPAFVCFAAQALKGRGSSRKPYLPDMILSYTPAVSFS